MTRRTVHVDGAVAGREYCRLPRATRQAVGVAVGAQVRLWHDGMPALFTVRDGGPAVTPTGRDRLEADGESFDAQVDPQVVHPDHDYETAREIGEFVECGMAGEDALIALAPHGGHVEVGTDAQARRLAECGATAWYCAGWWPGGGAFDRWHITSNETDPRSFSGLAAIADREFDRAVSFHGWTREGVGVGGGASPAIREHVRDAIANVIDAPVALITGTAYRGDNPANIVNRLAREGVQLEQGLNVRKESWAAVADAVSDALQ